MTARLNRFCLGLAIAGSAICLSDGSFAQTVQTDQAELARNQTQLQSGVGPSAASDGRIPSSPNDADLGEQEILKRSEGYQPFTASASVPFYWTSNVALVNDGEESDFLVAPAVALSYQPRFTNTLYGIVSVREQLFYYDRFDELNFGAFDVDVGLIYIIPRFYNMTLRAEYLYDRLTEKDSFDSFFENNSILLSAELPFKLGRGQQLFLGIDGNISFAADPEPPRRSDYEVYLGYSLKVARSLSLDAVGRVVWRNYIQTDRNDVSEVLALSATYSVTRFLTASAISTFAANQSNHSVFDYNVANVGGAVSLSIKF